MFPLIISSNIRLDENNCNGEPPKTNYLRADMDIDVDVYIDIDDIDIDDIDIDIDIDVDIDIQVSHISPLPFPKDGGNPIQTQEW
ncbi:hypothetical protein HGM15179_002482 [Zosterops borbonicus]|uniref:Uncharacterized protein n=1 Tax=Zosterops borbonicus TaxID=364589 RepID=A0A8K1GTQ5_9PASS|nr:hypothetical protein HGM15179_002482 [Zosterops borbonicus]